MALRLTTTSLVPEPPSSPSPSVDPYAPHSLAARGRAALLARHYDDFRACFEEAGAIEDPSERYDARKQLIEHGLAAGGQTAPQHAAEILLATATESVRCSRPSRPSRSCSTTRAWRCYELWSLDAAQALFRAANRLDPEVPHLQRNLAECTRRKRSAGRPKMPLYGVTPAARRDAPRLWPGALARPPG